MRSIARRDGQPCGGGRAGQPPDPWRPSRSPRCRRPAACRRRRGSSRSRAAAAIRAARLSLSVCSRSSETSAGLDQRRAADVVEHRVEVVLGLGEERVEEARGAGVVGRALPRGPPAGRGGRRTRAPAPRARGRASRPAPGARTGRRRRGANSHSAPASPKAIVRQPRPRASPSAARVSGSASASKPTTTSSGSTVPLGLGGERAALGREPERRQRPLADDHRVDELDRDVAGVRARRRRAAEGDQAAAAGEALGHPVTAARERLRLALEEGPVALEAARRAARRPGPPSASAVAVPIRPSPVG